LTVNVQEIDRAITISYHCIIYGKNSHGFAGCVKRWISETLYGFRKLLKWSLYRL
jgi:hypothetical protein